MTSTYVGGNNENDRVASPETALIHLKALKTQATSVFIYLFIFFFLVVFFFFFGLKRFTYNETELYGSRSPDQTLHMRSMIVTCKVHFSDG